MVMTTNVPLRRRLRITEPDTSMATIFVTADSSEPTCRYLAHENLVVHYSPFFKEALQGNFAEAESKTVTLTDVDPTDVEDFISWIYHQRFPERETDGLETVNQWSGTDGQSTNQTTRMISLYIFCDKYDVPDLKRILIDELFNHMKHRHTLLPRVGSTRDAFERLPHNDPLCHFLVDVHSKFAYSTVWTESEATA
ncbi:hypothetical protein E8E12_004159 [Didymella heteroderae]|uniref:BTB domain-containing protein n=1 Tax=Didymella heteroderae TaxID=1769908 RepID=A0A9P4WQX1_9PLEO|nr:hypothetical protein E8E12_004159 [Didymella heteroderae]